MLYTMLNNKTFRTKDNFLICQKPKLITFFQIINVKQKSI